MFRAFDPRLYSVDWPAIAQAAIYLGVGMVVAGLVHQFTFAVLARFAARTETPTDGILIEHVRGPSRWALGAIAIAAVAQVDHWVMQVWSAIAPFVVPALVGWLAYALVHALAAALDRRAESVSDLAAARSRRTRVAILSRTAVFVIVVITIGLMLLAIPVVRQVGVTLMASAGIAALFVGAAAQPALKSIIAGLQMALTEPLRIGDLVVVDGQTGRVEEIRMSYVVVRLWDERTAIVPTSRFLDTTFENWSRASEVLSGAVLLQLDPITEIAPLRAEFERYIATCPQWDQRSARAVVTESRAGSIEVRLAMSAATIADLSDLRFAVREHMLEWLRTAQPGALLSASRGEEPAASS